MPDQQPESLRLAGVLGAIERLRAALTWALGVNGDFRQQGTMDGAYWWRGELAERAGLEWDGTQYVHRATASVPALGEPLKRQATTPGKDDGEGHCERCGLLLEDPDEYGPHECPPGFLDAAPQPMSGEPCSECGLVGEHKLQCSRRPGQQMRVGLTRPMSGET